MLRAIGIAQPGRSIFRTSLSLGCKRQQAESASVVKQSEQDPQSVQQHFRELSSDINKLHRTGSAIAT